MQALTSATIQKLKPQYDHTAVFLQEQQHFEPIIMLLFAQSNMCEVQ